MSWASGLSDAEVVARAGRVAVLMGGVSAERAVSLRSGAAVLAALAQSGVDAYAADWRGGPLGELVEPGTARAFIALHGRGGEDGLVQGALGVAGIPYTGSGVLGCALSMDKVRSKQVWQSVGLPTPDFALAGTADPAAIGARLGLPLAVKPAREGSSIGVSRVESVAALPEAIASARRYDETVLIERWITGGEYTLSIVDGRTLPIIKLETPRAFYDYEAKYVLDTTRYLCPCGLAPELEQRCARLGLEAFEALGGAGWGRIDFMLDGAGEPWLIELNTVPGMTDHSLVPMAAAAIGVPFDRLVLRILATSFGGRP